MDQTDICSIPWTTLEISALEMKDDLLEKYTFDFDNIEKTSIFSIAK